MSVGLELAKFDMRSISFRPDENKGPVIVLIGRRDTGKSFLVKDLMIETRLPLQMKLRH